MEPWVILLIGAGVATIAALALESRIGKDATALIVGVAIFVAIGAGAWAVNAGDDEPRSLSDQIKEYEQRDDCGPGNPGAC